MAQVVFLRGVNVGGSKRFRPSLFAKELAGLDVVNYGAVGTFIVHGKSGSKSLREDILRKLPFKTEVMICPAEELIELALSKPFGEKSAEKETQWFVSVLADQPRALPRLPVECPATKDWEVRVVRVTGRFVCSLRKKTGTGGVYPNEVVEKNFGVAATTRGWNTITALSNDLQIKGVTA